MDEMVSETPPIPQIGGTLDFNGNGVAGCVTCGWRGAPTIIDGERSTFCPVCTDRSTEFLAELNADREASARRKEFAGTARNAPCPCGSGLKWKKCHGK
jgi:hypothetical protein